MPVNDTFAAWMSPEPAEGPVGGAGSLAYVPYDLMGGVRLLFCMAACDPADGSGADAIAAARDAAASASARMYSGGLLAAVLLGLDDAARSAMEPDPAFGADAVQAAYLAGRALGGAPGATARIDRPRRLTGAERSFVGQAAAWAAETLEVDGARACTACDPVLGAASNGDSAAMVWAGRTGAYEARLIMQAYPGASLYWSVDPITGSRLTLRGAGL